MKKNSHRQKKDRPPTVDFRPQKAILEAELRLQSQVPLEGDLAEITDLIQRFSCTEEEKCILLTFYTGAEPQPTSDTALIILEDCTRDILQSLPGTPEKAHFQGLIDKSYTAALGHSLGLITWQRSNQVLRAHRERTRDKKAPGSVVGTLESHKETIIEDVGEIPEQWVRQVATKEGLDHLPRTRSGQTSPYSLEERRKKAQVRIRKAGKSRDYREAAARLIPKLLKDDSHHENPTFLR